MSRRFLVAVAGLGLLAASVLANNAVAAGARISLAVTVPAGPFNPIMTNRENVRQLFYSVHEAAQLVPIGWTGSVANCNPGTVSADYLEAVRASVNYFRAMAGVPSGTTFTVANNANAQAAALMMSAQGALSHDPQPPWACWSQAGHDGAATSNLSLGNTGPQAIDALMFDGGALGHRRNMLDPAIATMGSGSVPSNPGGPASEANLVLTTPVVPRPTPRDTFVAWPPNGFVPYQTVYPRWSFNLPNADFSSATVTMQRNGVSIPTSIQTRDSDFAGPTITWLPGNIADGTPWPKPTADDVYTVTIANVAGVSPSSYTYNVTVFDPAVADPSHTQPVVAGPASAPSGQNTAYSFNAVPNAIAYKWRSTRLTALTATDGAEAGLVNFNSQTNGSYNPVQSARVAAGNNAFHLTLFSSTGGDFSDQTLTRKNAILVNANSALHFKSNTRNFDGLAARVEVTSDDGVTWTRVYQQISNGSEASFSDKVVSLGAFAGKTLRIRFSLTYNGGSVFIGSNDLGWFLDNIAFTNTQDASAPLVSDVPPNTTAFQFNPAQNSSTYNLQVQPQFFGSGPGDWGPAKQVTSPK